MNIILESSRNQYMHNYYYNYDHSSNEKQTHVQSLTFQAPQMMR